MSNQKYPPKINITFKPGDRVLCINGDFHFKRHPFIDLVAYSMIRKFPEHMEVYTIRRPHVSGRAILLAEIINPVLINAEGRILFEPHWKIERFIKLPKQKKERYEQDEIQLQLDLFLEAEFSEVTEKEVQK